MAIKMSIGGKYAGVKREPNPNTAGDVTKGSGGGQTTQREFIGSGVKSYTFTRVINGTIRTLVVRAHSVKEANTLASTRGFKTTDREIKRRRSKSRRR